MSLIKFPELLVLKLIKVYFLVGQQKASDKSREKKLQTFCGGTS